MIMTDFRTAAGRRSFFSLTFTSGAVLTLAVFLIFSISLILGGCSGSLPAGSGSSGQVSGSYEEKLTLHFIDVGQGDSILAGYNDHYLLIDAGENDQGDTVVAYLKEAGVESLDYVIGTHPHSDHIGGLDDVLQAFPVKSVILAPVSHTTKTFEDVLDAVKAQDLKVTRPVPGDSYSLGDAAFTILGPAGSYGDDLNNWSVGIRLSLGSRSFVLCGDAEETAETDMTRQGLTLQADVLKAGHHGSSTSSSAAFLKAVNPSWAVIQCGEGNSYGHPHKETLEAFSKAGIQVLRTDQLGTITAVTDGSSLEWSCEKGELPSEDSQEEETASSYVLNENTRKYHRPDCPSAEKIQPENRRDYTGSADDLIKEGYAPCGQCKPL